MKQENKDLLLKYLCMALPYGVICEDMEGKMRPLFGITPTQHFIVTLDNATNGTNGLKFCTIDCIKPYLRTMSSMTDEEYDQLYIDSRVKEDSVDILDALANDMDAIQWLLEHHFDFMGLIPKDLAIEVTEENNHYEN